MAVGESSVAVAERRCRSSKSLQVGVIRWKRRERPSLAGLRLAARNSLERFMPCLIGCRIAGMRGAAVSSKGGAIGGGKRARNSHRRLQVLKGSFEGIAPGGEANREIQHSRGPDLKWRAPGAFPHVKKGKGGREKPGAASGEPSPAIEPGALGQARRTHEARED